MGKIMRNSDLTIPTRPSRPAVLLLNAMVFVMIASWCQQSQATTGLWLWGWLGVSEIQIMQDPGNASSAKEVASGAAKVAPPAKYQNDPVRKNNAVTKVQSVDDTRNKDAKDRPLKIIIM
jgi:hypothetical protein